MSNAPRKAKLYLATKNLHKVDELRSMMGDNLWDVRCATELDPQISWDETGQTFVENARIKALTLRQYTKDAIIADDSGLMVDYLKGAPGVYSSRYAGPDGDDESNNNKLLTALKDVPHHQRTARFVCCLLFIDSAGIEHVFEGQVSGYIATTRRGSHGFGYDPIFLVENSNTCMAELPLEAKNTLSHRRRALEKWLQWSQQMTTEGQKNF